MFKFRFEGRGEGGSSADSWLAIARSSFALSDCCLIGYGCVLLSFFFLSRWYHDEITNGFHMAVTIGGDTYGFWDLGIVGAAGDGVFFFPLVLFLALVSCLFFMYPRK